MRFVVGPLPPDPGFDPEAPGSGWTRLAPADPTQTLVAGALLGGLLGILLFASWAVLHPSQFRAASSFGSLAVGLAGAPLIVPLHEALHGLCLPGGPFARHRTYGFWPQRLVFYTHHRGELSRGRLAACQLAPFVSLTLLPLAALPWIAPASAPGTVALLSVHTGLCGGDLLGFCISMHRIPRGARIRVQGEAAYVRTDAAGRLR